MGLILLVVTPIWEARGQDAAALRKQLDGVYNQWREAMVSKNLSRWQANTSRRRQVVVKNQIYSERRAFPAALFSLPVAPPDIRNLKALRAVAKGPTAKEVYFGKVDFGVGGEPSENLLVIDYVNEGGRWKYDGAEFVNLSKLPKVRAQLVGGDLQFLNSPDFVSSGSVAPVPIAINGPVRYITKAYVYCPGREVQLQINKISRHKFQNTKAAEVVVGGARDGQNEVQFLIKSLPGSTGAEPLAVRVYLMSEVRGVQPIKAFEYLVEEKAKPKGNGTMHFVVTPAMVKQLMGR